RAPTCEPAPDHRPLNVWPKWDGALVFVPLGELDLRTTYEHTVHSAFIRRAVRASPGGTDMMNASDRFDAVGIVVDWIDACRQRRLDALLDLYDDAATVECCEGGN